MAGGNDQEFSGILALLGQLSSPLRDFALESAKERCEGALKNVSTPTQGSLKSNQNDHPRLSHSIIVSYHPIPILPAACLALHQSEVWT
jgi:hypothetical protein